MAKISKLGQLILLGLAACSQAPGPLDNAVPSQQRPPSQAERVAARELSLGLSSALQKTTEPYDRALRCTLAIDGLRGALQDSGALTAEQLRLVDVIRANYVRQSGELGRQAGKTSRDIESDLSDLREADAGSPRSGSLALACLQQGATGQGAAAAGRS